ncbi:hypothetical protein KIN20_014091 [Parelaphostrongylus tenuis]|uniref:Uncharacterized protein n=1 Tax=Parelaphostrongylus tenuis TaxID=148309 RepID=A0AAD5MD38_PARTN|nr:hypothetical protein KIN20_014091 [Parelaphostrongylus tenuis]
MKPCVRYLQDNIAPKSTPRRILEITLRSPGRLIGCFTKFELRVNTAYAQSKRKRVSTKNVLPFRSMFHELSQDVTVLSA